MTELSARDTPIFSLPDDNLSKRQWIFTKLGTCIDMKEIWFGIVNEKISSMFDRVICPLHDNGGVLYFNVFIHREQVCDWANRGRVLLLLFFLASDINQGLCFVSSQCF